MNFEIKIKEKSFFNKHDKSKIKVLKNIDITINSNEFVCIVGPSGCGKTTLMNMIGGLIETKDQIINSKIQTVSLMKALVMFFKPPDFYPG